MRWLYWVFYYWFKPPVTITDHVHSLMKTKRPWWKFKPSAYHSKEGGFYQIYLKDDICHTVKKTLTLDCFVSDETEEIVGFQIFEPELRGGQDAT